MTWIHSIIHWIGIWTIIVLIGLMYVFAQDQEAENNRELLGCLIQNINPELQRKLVPTPEMRLAQNK